MNYGKLIRMFLVEGDPDGIVTAEIQNMTIFITSFPRTKINVFKKRYEAIRPGVYILIGDNNNNNNFMKTINKLILVEPYLNANIQKNIEEIYSNQLELAYVPQSERNKKLGYVDQDEDLMSKFNAIKLSDSKAIREFFDLKTL